MSKSVLTWCLVEDSSEICDMHIHSKEYQSSTKYNKKRKEIHDNSGMLKKEKPPQFSIPNPNYNTFPFFQSFLNRVKNNDYFFVCCLVGCGMGGWSMG